MPRKIRVKNKFIKYRLLVVAAAVIVLALVLFFTLRAQNPTSTIIPSTNPANPTGNQSQNNGSQNNSASNSQQNSSSGSASGSVSQTPSNKTQSPSGPLEAPFGDFVSNHSPSLSSPTLSQEYSVCDTTTGATCYIEFTKDGVVKKLAAETTDSTGSAYWRWNVNDAGLTTGDWTITAVASLGGQTKSTGSSIPLSIKP